MNGFDCIKAITTAFATDAQHTVTVTVTLFSYNIIQTLFHNAGGEAECFYKW